MQKQKSGSGLLQSALRAKERDSKSRRRCLLIVYEMAAGFNRKFTNLPEKSPFFKRESRYRSDSRVVLVMALARTISLRGQTFMHSPQFTHLL